MSIRIQLRRGTAANWTTANPILAEGEVGFESNTGIFKIGDGTTAWNSLSYASMTPAQITAAVEAAIAGVIDLSPSTLDTLNELANAIGDDPDFINTIKGYADDAAQTALNDAKTYANNEIDALVAAAPSVLNTLKEIADSLNNDANFSNTIMTYVDNNIDDKLGNHSIDTTNVHGIADTSVLETTTGAQSKADAARDTAITQATTYIYEHPTFTADVTLPSHTVIGDVSPTEIATLSGVTSAIQTQINTKAPRNAPTFTGTVTLPSTTSIGDVSATEISYVNGVTSGIQSQIDAVVQDVADTSTYSATTYAPINSPAFTGTVTGITKTMIDLGNVNNTSDADKPISDATQAALDLKAPIDSPTFTGTVSGVTKAMVGLGNVTNTSDANKPVSTATQTALDAKASTADLSDHASDTTNIHGIADTSVLETTTGAQSKADAAEAAAKLYADGIVTGAVSVLDTSAVAEGTNLYYTNERAQDAVGNSVGQGLTYDDTSGSLYILTNFTGGGGITVDSNNAVVIDTDVVVTKTDTQTLTNKTIDTADNSITIVAADISDITASATELNYVDGVTSSIQTQLDAKASLSGATFTGTVNGITKSMVGLGNVTNTSDANKPVSTAQQTALDLKADLAHPTFTGKTTVADLEIGGALTFTGTATQIDQTNLTVEDSLIYLADAQYNSDILDIGIYGAYGDSNPGHFHTGLIRDASDGKWKLISGGAEPVTNVVDFTGVTYDTLKIGALEATSATIGNVSDTELQYLDGVTSAIQTQIDAKAPLNSPTFTGTVTLPTGTVTSTMIADGTIVNGDISASAAIAATKIAGTAITAADTGTVTNTMLAGSIDATKVTGTAITAADTGTVTSTMILNGTITNTDINASAGIAATKISGTAVTQADTGTVTNTMLAGSIAASKVTGTAVTQADTGTVTSTMILDGTIVDGDINASAAIAKTKISGTAITAADTGTVTSTMIADGTIVNGDISASAAIAVSKLASSTISGVTLGSNLNALTIGTGLSGTSYNGSAGVTVAIDSTVATLTGTQTLTNKTLTAPALTTPTVSSGTLTVASAGITFSDGTVQTKAAVPSLTTISQQTTSYTLAALTERDSMIEIASGSATNLTIPPDSTVNFPVGTTIDVLQTSTGQVTIVAGAGVTVNATPGLKLRTQWSSATLMKRAANTWVVFGDLSA